MKLKAVTKDNCFQLGHIAKLHGYKGEVSLFFDTTHPEDYAQLDAVFIEIEGNLIPFFVEEIKIEKKEFARVKFEGIDSEKEARDLIKKDIFLPLDQLPQLEGKNFHDHEIIGFEAIDVEKGKFGIVQQVIDFKTNPLLQVLNKEQNKEILLPLHVDLVQEVNRETKQIVVKAPEGLIDLYLE